MVKKMVTPGHDLAPRVVPAAYRPKNLSSIRASASLRQNEKGRSVQSGLSS